jgi:hypothetical protein
MSRWDLRKLTARRSRGDPYLVMVVGFTFIVMSAAMCVWQWAHGQPAGASQGGAFSAGLLVLCVGLYLDNRRLRRGGTH